jgi:hypothetical protein
MAGGVGGRCWRADGSKLTNASPGRRFVEEVVGPPISQQVSTLIVQASGTQGVLGALVIHRR